MSVQTLRSGVRGGYRWLVTEYGPQAPLFLAGGLFIVLAFVVLLLPADAAPHVQPPGLSGSTTERRSEIPNAAPLLLPMTAHAAPEGEALGSLEAGRMAAAVARCGDDWVQMNAEGSGLVWVHLSAPLELPDLCYPFVEVVVDTPPAPRSEAAPQVIVHDAAPATSQAPAELVPLPAEPTPDASPMSGRIAHPNHPDKYEGSQLLDDKAGSTP